MNNWESCEPSFYLPLEIKVSLNLRYAEFVTSATIAKEISNIEVRGNFQFHKGIKFVTRFEIDNWIKSINYNR